MPVTIVDIAKKLKLSHATVSRVLNKREDRFISNATRERVLLASQELGYRPNMTARALVTGRTGRIAFWSPAMGGRFFQELAYRFHKTLKKDNFEMITGEIGLQMLDPSNTMGLTRMDVDGVIMYGGGLGGLLKTALESNFPQKAPIVNIGSIYDGNLDFVMIDLYPASREAVQYLLNTGRKRVAQMLIPSIKSDEYGRYRAYRDVLTEAGLPTEFILTPEGTSFTAREIICDYVKANGCPDAIFCSNDEIALGAFRGLRDLGKRIPQDVALIGCDGIDEVAFVDPPLATISQPVEEMCNLVWEILHRRMENSEIGQQKAVLKASFVLRESCKRG